MTKGFQALWDEQHGKCASCAADMARASAAVDHDPDTGEGIALLCIVCSDVLRCFDRNPETLQRAVDYLEKAGK